MQKRQLGLQLHQDIRRIGSGLALQPRICHPLLQLVMAQVVRNRHLFDQGAAAAQFQRGFVDLHIQGHRRAGPPLLQGEVLHQCIGQHGDFETGHVDGGQALAGNCVDFAARLQSQSRRSNVDTQGDAATAQTLHRKCIVNLGGCRIVNRKRGDCRQRKAVIQRRRIQSREAGALGKILQGKTLPMELVGRIDGTGFLQQGQGRCLAGARSLDHRFVFGSVFIRLEQNFVELLTHGLRALTDQQFLRPQRNLRQQLLLLFDTGQRLGNHVGAGFAEAAFAGTAKVMRCLEQGEQHRCLLLNAGLGTEVVAGQFGKSKLRIGREFPGHFQFHLLAQGRTGRHENRRGG